MVWSPENKIMTVIRLLAQILSKTRSKEVTTTGGNVAKFRHAVQTPVIAHSMQSQ